MNKSVLIGVAVVIVAVLVIVFGFSKKSESPAPTEQQPTQESTSQQGTESEQPQETEEEVQSAVTIVYTDEGFAESSYQIKSGGTVTVQNNSSEVLEFSSDNHPSHTKNTELNMDAVQPGGTVQFTVQTTGAWGFHNHLLASHTGVLTVR